MKRQTLISTFVIFVIAATIALAAVPKLINYQGMLRDGSGNPVPDGPYSVAFTIYTAPSGGNIFWTQTYSVTTSGGLFSVQLGSGPTPIPDTTFNDTTCYLGIKVGADPEMTPRQRLTSNGYSFVSNQWTSTTGDIFRLNGNVGIGTSTPTAKLDVGGTLLVNPANQFVGVNRISPITASEYFGVKGAAGNGLYGGMYISSAPFDGKPFYGYYTQNHSAWTYVDGANGDWRVYNGADRMTVANNGNVSIGSVTVDSVKLKVENEFGNTGIDANGGNCGLRANGANFGVFATSSAGTGILATGTVGAVNGLGGSIGVNGRGDIYGVIGFCNVSGNYAIYGTDGGNLATFAGYFSGDVRVDGDFAVTGVKSSTVKMNDGDYHLLYAQESPENWFEDFGTAQLVNGRVVVNIDPAFAQTVSTAVTYHVFVTPEGDCNGLYVSNKNKESFEIRELQNGKSNLSFSYRIVAKRKGYENARLEKLPGESPEEVRAKQATMEDKLKVAEISQMGIGQR